MHYIIHEEQSLDLLLNDLEMLYRALMNYSGVFDPKSLKYEKPLANRNILTVDRADTCLRIFLLKLLCSLLSRFRAFRKPSGNTYINNILSALYDLLKLFSVF